MYPAVLLLHLLAATIWTGGHLALSFVVLPRALREKSPQVLLDFEAGYERIGMPALLIQVASGLWLASLQLPPEQWFAFATSQSHLIAGKLTLLALTVAFAVDARFRVIPRLSPASLKVMAWHVWPVTAFSVLFVALGVGFRFGWG